MYIIYKIFIITNGFNYNIMDIGSGRFCALDTVMLWSKSC